MLELMTGTRGWVSLVVVHWDVNCFVLDSIADPGWVTEIYVVLTVQTSFTSMPVSTSYQYTIMDFI